MSFIETEMQKRQAGHYTYDLDGHTFLENINAALLEQEEQLLKEVEESSPTIWVLGLPRSGTTLLTQLLAFTLDLGYVNNLIARFWKTPLCGTKLSQIVLGGQKYVDYSSEYGKSKNISIPHEFSYFWNHWLKLDTWPHYNPQEAEFSIDWVKLRLTLINMARLWERPMVHKALDVVYHAKKFHELFAQSLFIYIERDPLDVAISMAKARMSHYGDLQTWWSMYPLEYDLLKDLSFDQQIAGQIFYLNRLHEQALSQLPRNQVLKIRYQDLCQDPAYVIDKVRSQVRDLYEYELQLTNKCPQSFELKKQDIDNDIKQRLEVALSKYFA